MQMPIIIETNLILSDQKWEFLLPCSLRDLPLNEGAHCSFEAGTYFEEKYRVGVAGRDLGDSCRLMMDHVGILWSPTSDNKFITYGSDIRMYSVLDADPGVGGKI